MNNFVIFLSLYVWISLKINAEVFSSLYKMELLLKTQKCLIDSLNNFTKKNKSENKLLENYLQRLKVEHEAAIPDISGYLGNPVNSFRLIKRLTIDVKLIENVFNVRSVIMKNYNVTFPTEEDLVGAAEGLLRLETIYNLNINRLSNGIWNTSYSKERKLYVEKFNPMTISDCYELGKALCKIKYYSQGIEWLKEALNKKSFQGYRFPEDNKITLDAINDEIIVGYKSSENLMYNFTLWFNAIAIQIPNITKLNPDLVVEIYKDGLRPSEAIEAIKSKENVAASLDAPKVTSLSYAAICKGETKRLEKLIEHNIFCYFAQGPHPFLKLAPIKAELLQRAPDITLFYDVISDAEIQMLYEIAKPRLKRGQVGGSSITNISNNRVCQVGYTGSNESIVAARLRTRVSQISGMDVDNSERLQVANYGIGGHFSPHYDYWSNDTYIAKMGNRIATVLFYMTEVTQGGATAFPRLGLTVFPVKGAALFWTNLLPSGQGNPLTYHTACPVLRGSKWVTTQWISLRGQELNRPCPLNGKG